MKGSSSSTSRTARREASAWHEDAAAVKRSLASCDRAWNELRARSSKKRNARKAEPFRTAAGSFNERVARSAERSTLAEHTHTVSQSRLLSASRQDRACEGSLPLPGTTPAPSPRQNEDLATPSLIYPALDSAHGLDLTSFHLLQTHRATCRTTRWTFTTSSMRINISTRWVRLSEMELDVMGGTRVNFMTRLAQRDRQACLV